VSGSARCIPVADTEYEDVSEDAEKVGGQAGLSERKDGWIDRRKGRKEERRGREAELRLS